MLDRIDQVFELDKQQGDPTRARKCQVPKEPGGKVHGVLWPDASGTKLVCTHRHGQGVICQYEEPGILYPTGAPELGRLMLAHEGSTRVVN